MRVWRFARAPAIDIGLHDFARGINVVAIETGAMIFVFADDLKATNRSAMSFSTAGYPGRRGSVVSSVEIGFLLPQAHHDRWPAPVCLSGRFDVTRSVMVPQPLKTARVAASAQDCESRFIIRSDQVHATSKHYQCRWSAMSIKLSQARSASIQPHLPDLPNRFAFHFNVR